MNNLPVIIDTDGGADDYIALVLALHSKKLNVTKMISSYGNFSEVQVYSELKEYIDTYDKDSNIEIVSGSDRLLSKQRPMFSSIHGDHVKKTNIQNILISKLKKKRLKKSCFTDKCIYVSLGPLTNLAKIRSFSTSSNITEIVIMGGAISYPGNVNKVSEANFFWDPPATKKTLKSFNNISLIPLNITEQIQLSIKKYSSKKMLTFLSKKFTSYSQFYLKNKINYFDTKSKTKKKYVGPSIHDAIPIAYLIDRSLLTFSEINISLDKIVSVPGFIYEVNNAEINKDVVKIKVATHIDCKKFWLLFNDIIK